MKKLYRKGTVHPTPPHVSGQLSFLPAAILTLTSALSQQDREVLAYLLSCSSGNFSTVRATNNSHKSSTTSSSVSGGAAAKGGATADHPPSFNCYCFNCYRSYWVRWDSSPNRQLIDEIIEAYEDGLQSKKEKNRGGRRKSNKGSGSSGELRKSELTLNKDDSDDTESTAEIPSNSGGGGGGGGGDGEDDGEEGAERGSVRRLVSFLGGRIWSVWT